MTDRNKLICLMAKIVPLSLMQIGKIADFLTENGVVIPIRCKDCANKEPCTIRGKVWCRRIGRYMKEDGYCSEGKADEALQQLQSIPQEVSPLPR